MTGALLTIDEVSVSYGPINALSGITFEVAERSATAVLGANGAGKSTLVKAIAGLVKFGGNIGFNGAALPRDAAKVAKAGIGHVPEGRRVFARLSVIENLRLGGIGSGRQAQAEGVERATVLFPVLGQRARQAAGTMSGGEQQMIAIGRALVRRPTLLLLDEPTLGLAPMLAQTIYDSIATIRAQGTTVVVVEQEVMRARQVADQAVLLNRGSMVACGDPAAAFDETALDTAYLARGVE